MDFLLIELYSMSYFQQFISQCNHIVKIMSYQDLFDQGKAIAQKYSLAYLMEGYTPDLVNILLNNHIEKVKAADSFDTTLVMFNDGIKALSGFNVKVDCFVTDEKDVKKLYEIFQEWRLKILAPVSDKSIAQVATCPFKMMQERSI